MQKDLTAELKRKTDRRETCSTCSSITINLLEMLGMVVAARVMLELVEEKADTKGDPILMRGDSTSAVSWISPCGGVRDKRACLLMMRMLGRLEIKGGCNHTAKHIPGVRNTLADGIISRWPRVIRADKVRELTNSDDWSEQDIGTRG